MSDFSLRSEIGEDHAEAKEEASGKHHVPSALTGAG